MNEVITDKDKEYEAMEQSSAPGPDQAMSDRVNNRSLRPRSEAFKEFMTTGWDDNEPVIEPLESSHYIQARLDTLGKAFPGERIVIPAGYDVFILHRFGRRLRSRCRAGVESG